jgi:hypothetical protein
VDLILNVTVFVVRFWVGQYREELLMNFTIFFQGLGRAI